MSVETVPPPAPAGLPVMPDRPFVRPSLAPVELPDAGLALARWPFYAFVGVLCLFVLLVGRGLGWQWMGIVTGTQPVPPQTAPAPAGNRPSAPSALPPGVPAAAPAAKVPLPPTDDPPPRNVVDRYGVTYDDNAIAVLGIEADTNGVYNVPPGRQLRIGGPQGQLFDVQPGGKLTPATTIKLWPR